MFSSITNAITAAFADMRRNIRLTLLTIVLIAIAFLFVDALVFVSVSTKALLSALNERIAMVAYFAADTPEETITAAKRELDGTSGIRAIEYVTAAEAHKRFVERHEGDGALVGALRLFPESPFLPRLVIALENPAAFSSVKERIAQGPYARFLRDTSFTNVEAVAERVRAVSDRIESATTGLLIFFSILALLAMYSVVALRVDADHDAIEVMRMVGATPRIIELPFFVVSLFSVLAALAINLAVIIGGIAALREPASVFFAGLPENPIDLVIQSLPVLSIWKLIVAYILITVSAVFALRRHVRV